MGLKIQNWVQLNCCLEQPVIERSQIEDNLCLLRSLSFNKHFLLSKNGKVSPSFFTKHIMTGRHKMKDAIKFRDIFSHLCNS